MIDTNPFTLEEAEEIAEDFEDLVDSEFIVTNSGEKTTYLIDAVVVCPFPEAGRQHFVDEYYSSKNATAALAQYEGDEYDVLLFVSDADDVARFSYLSIRAFAAEQGGTIQLSIMNHINIAIELGRNKEVFRSLLHGVDEVQLRWKPAADKWCLLEIICHLYDEEIKDFRPRVERVLENPILPLDPIDPQGWVTSGSYMQQDFETMLNNFLVERGRSTDYISGLVAPMWSNAYNHPEQGPMSAWLLLNNWLAHDYHHIRQINNVKYQYLQSITKEPLDYAGKW